MAKENKTAPTAVDVDDFLDGVANERQRREARELVELMGSVTGEPPVMWGPSMVGFGTTHYRYDSGREGDTLTVGFAPRTGKFALYGLTGSDGAAALLERLGPHQAGASCLYVKRLEAVDVDVLRELVALAWSERSSVS